MGLLYTAALALLACPAVNRWLHWVDGEPAAAERLCWAINSAAPAPLQNSLLHNARLRDGQIQSSADAGPAAPGHLASTRNLAGAAWSTEITPLRSLNLQEEAAARLVRHSTAAALGPPRPWATRTGPLCQALEGSGTRLCTSAYCRCSWAHPCRRPAATLARRLVRTKRTV